VLGNALAALSEERPRESYKLISKCGRYNSEGFDYSPANIETSIRRSLRRLQTSYLDVVCAPPPPSPLDARPASACLWPVGRPAADLASTSASARRIDLHDVEFVSSTTPALQKTNRPLSFLEPDGQALAGLSLDSASSSADRQASLGVGDDLILGAWKVLVRLRDEGLIREIGISGYPLPCLLRLSHLLSPAPSSILSYSHSNLQNEAFGGYLPHFPADCRLLTASPLNMGLLVPSGAPDWHPALSDPKNASILPVSREAAEVAAAWPGGLPDVALGYGLRNLPLPAGKEGVVPVVVGAKNPDEVHQAVRVWREVNESRADDVARREMEQKVRDVWVRGGWEDVSWESPPRAAA
jgi:D-arabinose 1-dehydrogenase